MSVSAERSNWNMEEEVESAIRPPSGQEASLQHHCNGETEDSSSETSSYSESSRAAPVRHIHAHSLHSVSGPVSLTRVCPPPHRAPQWAGLRR